MFCEHSLDLFFFVTESTEAGFLFGGHTFSPVEFLTETEDKLLRGKKWCHDILSACLYVNLTHCQPVNTQILFFQLWFIQLDNLYTYHFVNLPFCHCLNRHFVKMIILSFFGAWSFCRIAILSPQHKIYLVSREGPKCLAVDKMISWKYGKLTKCQVDKMASWQIAKWQVDQMASWWNAKLIKWQITKLAHAKITK